MVENSTSHAAAPIGGSCAGDVRRTRRISGAMVGRRRPVRFAAVAAIASALAVVAIVTLGSPRSASVPTSSPHPAATRAKTIAKAATGTTKGVALGTTAASAAPDPVPAVSKASAPATSATASTSATPSATTATVSTAAQPVAVEPSVATLVAEVEAAGVDPGSNWSWSTGDTATHCGPISGSGTGCTYGSDGREYTVFAGTPTLALVAHELANAETQNDAVPDVLSEVATAAAGTSWSPTDAVASCLVAHYLGIQDVAAGTWTCAPAVATFVANNIHDTLSTVVGPIPS